MLFDPYNRPLKRKRTIGFVPTYEFAAQPLAVIGSLSVVGIEVPEEKDEEESDAADARRRMRRTG